MVRALIACTLALALFGGCRDPHCDKLVQAACEHLETQNHDDSVERCDRLKEQAKLIEDEQCKKTLRLLKESGKIESGSSS